MRCALKREDCDKHKHASLRSKVKKEERPRVWQPEAEAWWR